jgi:hypothetical protein
MGHFLDYMMTLNWGLIGANSLVILMIIGVMIPDRVIIWSVKKIKKHIEKRKHRHDVIQD